MILNIKNIKSSIKKDENTGLYEIILPGIKRYFEGIILNNNGVRREYGSFDKDIDIKNNVSMKDKTFCVSSFFDYKIACFIDLKSMNSDYFFFTKSKIFNFDLEGNTYFCFAYKDYKGKILFYSDYKGEDFSLEKRKKKIIIKNNIFGTNIFEEDISDLFTGENDKNIDIFTEDDDKKYLDIADFYIFDDYFTEISGYGDFYKFLSVFSDKDIEISNNTYLKFNIIKYKDIFCPRFKLNISFSTKNINNDSLSEIRKLILSYLSENILLYIINNDNIIKYFDKHIKNVSKTSIDVLDLNYEIPDNIYNSNIKFIEFKNNILFLRYNYFKLKDSIKELRELKNLNNNPNVNLSNTRAELTQKNLKQTLVLYEKKLKEILALIKV